MRIAYTTLVGIAAIVAGCRSTAAPFEPPDSSPASPRAAAAELLEPGRDLASLAEASAGDDASPSPARGSHGGGKVHEQ